MVFLRVVPLGRWHDFQTLALRRGAGLGHSLLLFSVIPNCRFVLGLPTGIAGRMFKKFAEQLLVRDLFPVVLYANGFGVPIPGTHRFIRGSCSSSASVAHSGFGDTFQLVECSLRGPESSHSKSCRWYLSLLGERKPGQHFERSTVGL